LPQKIGEFVLWLAADARRTVRACIATFT